MESITLDFLKAKAEVKFKNPWSKHGEEIRCNPGSGNVTPLTNNVMRFQIHNLLATSDDDILDGHYTILVNYKTFEYFIYSHAYYGSLTYTTNSKDSNVYNHTNLPEISKVRVEGYIANKLLGAYKYDGNHINQQGENLIEGSRIKCSCIFDNRGYVWSGGKVESIDDNELPLVKQLDKDFKECEVTNIRYGKILRRQANHSKDAWGYEVEVSVDVDNVTQNLMMFRYCAYGMTPITSYKKDGVDIGKYSFNVSKPREATEILKQQLQYAY